MNFPKVLRKTDPADLPTVRAVPSATPASSVANPPADGAPMVEWALYWAETGFHVFPVCWPTPDGQCGCGRKLGPHVGKQVGKGPLIKGWPNAATRDPVQIRKSWQQWPNANIGALDNERSGVLVVDNDKNSEEAQELRTQMVQMTRLHESGGADYKWHAVFRRPPGVAIQAKHTTVLGVNTESSGQFLLPPSLHRSGRRYSIVSDLPIAEMPPGLLDWLQSLPLEEKARRTKTEKPGKPVAHQQAPAPGSVCADIMGGMPKAFGGDLQEVPPFNDYERANLEAALWFCSADGTRVLDPRDPSFDTWSRVLYPLAWLVRHGWPWEWVLALLIDWSAEAAGLQDAEGRDIYPGPDECARRLQDAVKSGDRQGDRGPRTVASIYELVRQHGWLPAMPEAEMPQVAQPAPADDVAGTAADDDEETEASRAAVEAKVNELNQQYFVVRMGGKTLIGEFVTEDGQHDVLSLQSTEAFNTWMANRKVKVRDRAGNVRMKPLARVWLEHRRRRQYAGVDLVPGDRGVLENGYLNLWRGWGVQPVAGEWPRLREHVHEVLANGNEAEALYIFKWVAWSLQNPDKIAEVALALLGPKGAGKGVFARALRRIWGGHGLHLVDQHLLIGRFRGHLRHALFVIVDEAFWSGGDKASIGAIQGLITEDRIVIEQKGIDASLWRNRLHLMLLAEQEKVLPAGAGERRYVVVEASDRYAKVGTATEEERRAYFGALNQEIEHGGVEAMMHDLMDWDLGSWHPRQTIDTAALRRQQTLNMNVLEGWFETVLMAGRLAPQAELALGTTPANCATWASLASSFEQQTQRKVNDATLRLFLEQQGGQRWRNKAARGWQFLPLAEHRERWVRRYGRREWESPETADWQ
jgi:hypothetical protein